MKSVHDPVTHTHISYRLLSMLLPVTAPASARDRPCFCPQPRCLPLAPAATAATAVALFRHTTRCDPRSTSPAERKRDFPSPDYLNYAHDTRPAALANPAAAEAERYHTKLSTPTPTLTLTHIYCIFSILWQYPVNDDLFHYHPFPGKRTYSLSHN